MATGDMRNNLKKLQKQTGLIRYSEELDYDGLAKGDPLSHLSLLYHAFFEYNDGVLEYLSQNGYDLSGKRGVAFMTVIYKILREKCPTVPLSLKVQQFMLKGFAERKIILTTSILEFVRSIVKQSSKNHNCKKSARCNKVDDPPEKQFTIPDISCIQRSDEYHITPQIPESEALNKQMQSTAISVVRNVAPKKVNNEIPSLSSNHSVSVSTDPNDTTIEQQHEDSESHKGEVLPGLSDVIAAMSRLRQVQNSVVESLGRANSELMSRVSKLEGENERLNKEITSMSQVIKSNNENMSKRLDLLEVKLCDIQLYEQQNSKGSQSLGRSIDDLSFHSKSQQLVLPQGSSLSNITNSSPMISNHAKAQKLFDIVRGTRSLLGMDIHTPKSSKLIEENTIPAMDESIDD